MYCQECGKRVEVWVLVDGVLYCRKCVRED